MEVVLKVNGNVINYASWLRPTGNTKHINLAELDVTIKCMKLTLQLRAS